ncbi:hydrogen peroxide-inducible genes activator [Magnetovibrio blakemorei]|uniref:LysR family transcriptional regulator n=1 Tax=Magnetovibrio blakemorei TaxID=28181 RepID=A0A1E5Q8Z3_9PROT|nr:hydrogen peroxide-inducible genes activator [Magnetovibrio blakemorei]OEJ67764.1 LysR family transcriptional regulator [Magnetovibrio blakemorei]
MYLPTLRQLEYLIAVVDLCHFGQAAERCHVTQSTLSAGLSELENLLQAELVERTRRKVQPTPLGLEIAEKARTVLEGARDIAEVATAAGLPLSGRMRMGIIPTIGPFVLPRVLGGLRQAYPDLKLYLTEGQSADVLDQLHRGDLEAAIIALPYDTGNLKTFDLGGDAFWVALPKGHALAKKRSLSPADLPTDELLMLADGHCLRDHALAACSLAGFKHSGEFASTSLYTLAEMVANGLGITFLPEIALNSGMINTQALELRPLKTNGAPRQIALVWRASFRRDLDIAALGAYLRGRMAGLRVKRKI